MRALAQRGTMRVKATWTQVGDVESESEPGVLHVISRRSTDSHLGCDCMAYRFAKGEKTCKHLLAFAAGVRFAGRVSEHIPEIAKGAPVNHRVGGELFTVRAISFGF